jgi:hypothetical protein
VVPALPKPTNLPTQELPTNELTDEATMTSGDAPIHVPVASAAVVEPIAFTEPGKVVPLKGRAKKREAAEVSAVTPLAGRAMTAHPKPEKRKNAKERAKEKYAKKNFAKDDAKEETTDGTRPMTATAKSKVDKKAEAKAKKHKAA